MVAVRMFSTTPGVALRLAEYVKQVYMPDHDPHEDADDELITDPVDEPETLAGGDEDDGDDC